jgi:hypothetical protein
LEVLTSVLEEPVASIFRVDMLRLMNRKLYRRNGVIGSGNRRIRIEEWGEPIVGQWKPKYRGDPEKGPLLW